MSTTPDQSPSAAQSVEETLEKTDFGHIINENKKPILIIGLIIIVLIIGYAVFEQIQESKRKDMLEEVYKTEASLFNPFLAEKSEMTVEQFNSQLSAMNKQFIGHPNLVPSYLQALNKINQQEKLTASDLETAKNWLSKIDKRSELYLFTGLRLSILFENNGQTKEAISILEDIEGKNFSVLKERINFELGRLYHMEGNSEKAKAYLEKVVASEQQTDYKNMAKIYLSEL